MRKRIIAAGRLCVAAAHPSSRGEPCVGPGERNVLQISREINKRENVILFNKPEADEALHHPRQAVQEGYITALRFFLTCHVEI